MKGTAALLAVTLALLSGCTRLILPRFTFGPVEKLGISEGVFLVANSQRDRVLESLQKSGISITNDLADARYVLNVQVGKSRAHVGCGTINQVRYSIKADGREIAATVGRGRTGQCAPNLFDAMSRKMFADLFWRERKTGPWGLYADRIPPELRSPLGRNTGAYVVAVKDDSPAFFGNILPADVVIRAAGQEVLRPSDLEEIAANMTDGQVELDLIRPGQGRVKVTLQLNRNLPPFP